MTMRMSADGRARLTAREGIRLKAYLDSVGVLTIGIGHTTAAGPPRVTKGMTITRAECDEIFARDLVKYEDAVNAAVKVPVSQGEFDALVSLCYNIGPGGFKGSTIVKRLNAGDRSGAAAAFMLWQKPKEIIGRRQQEQKQFIDAGPPGATPQHAIEEAIQSARQTLRYGSKGGDVQTLQGRLNANGANLKVDGDFGLLTERAVRLFQEARKLVIDGVVGPQTWAALN